jgi:hypothetical protein
LTVSDCFDHEGDAWCSLEDFYNGGGPHPNWPRLVTCNRCGAKGLVWGKVHNRKTGYQLMNDDGEPHASTCNAAQDDEFEDLTRKD